MLTCVALIDEQTLRSAAREEMMSLVQDSLPDLIRKATMKPFLSNAEVAELTGYTVRQLGNLRKRGSLSYIKRGNSVWYKTEDVWAWFEEGYIPSRLSS